MVKQPPCMSAAVSLPARAFLEISARSRDSSMMPFLLTSRTTGTTRPLGVSTATPMWMYFFMISLLPSSDRALQKRGCASRALAAAFRMNTSGVIFTSSFCFSARMFCSLRNASRSVVSASSNWVTWGIMAQLRCRAGPEIFWIRVSSSSSTGPNLLKSTFGHGSTFMPLPLPVPAAGADSARLTASFT